MSIDSLIVYCHAHNIAVIFRRNRHDLILRMNIDLVEALCGFQKVIRTLDDRDLVVTVIPGTKN